MQHEEIEPPLDRIRHRQRPVEHRQTRLRHDRAIETINGFLLPLRRVALRNINGNSP
jgi:hypothetical protein